MLLDSHKQRCKAGQPLRLSQEVLACFRHQMSCTNLPLSPAAVYTPSENNTSCSHDVDATSMSSANKRYALAPALMGQAYTPGSTTWPSTIFSKSSSVFLNCTEE